ncbi:hypothetical protein BIFADO_02039 [Bifidobacterium adolescentis L2-32]|uniref:Uncharacterized protein n=1 Tax=Bifidobacterium adolescentis L2-32 TaxID=411481 RepID=A7A849_BIFAD|nr:hypothetical protein BIFADO_02039 [Bifidobacterium adolescentis L2-32]
MEAIIESAGWTDGTRCLQERENRISMYVHAYPLIRGGHQRRGKSGTRPASSRSM